MFKKFFNDPIEFQSGTCNGLVARKNLKTGHVQFKLWSKGDQKYIDGIGHTEDKWVNFDPSWWDSFIQTK